MISRQTKWDKRFLALAQHIAGWSKDPSTQTGAVIVDRTGRVVSVGFNGMPRGVADTADRLNNRDVKYKHIVHCEVNAIVFARQDLTDCTLYTWPFLSCCPCASVVIQSGITRCVAPIVPNDKKERWETECARSEDILKEAGVSVRLFCE